MTLEAFSTRVQETDAYSSMAAAVGDSEQGSARRLSMQDWQRFPYLLRRTQWQRLNSAEQQIKKIEMVVDHLVACGLRCPTERTQATICALITHMAPEEDVRRIEEDPIRATALLSTVKGLMKQKVLRAKQLGTPLLGQVYLTELPATVGELPSTFQHDMFHRDVAYEPPIDLNPVWLSASNWVCRSTNQRLRQDVPLASLGQQAFVQQSAIVASTVMAMAACGHMQATSTGLPGLQIFANAQREARPQSSELRQLMDRAEQSAEPAAARGSALKACAPESAKPPLAIEDGSVAATKKENAGSSKDAASKDAASAHEEQAEKVPSNEIVAATSPLSGELEKSMEALARAHYEKELPDTSSVQQAQDRSAAKGRGMKRPAATQAMRKPAARNASGQDGSRLKKKPASKQNAIAKPQKDQGSKKKLLAAEAGKGKQKERKKFVAAKSLAEKSLAVSLRRISHKVAAKKFPHGCSRCRQTVGCSRSCWKRRHFELVD